MSCKEEFLNFANDGGAHTTSVLDTKCHASQWHIAKLSHNYAKICWVIKPAHEFCAMPKSKLANMHPYSNIRMKKEFHSTMWSTAFGIVLTTSSSA
jgi:hypothetical protein